MLRYEVVDVFAVDGTPFTGNPLAVVLDGAGLTTSAMQAIAREFHLSETAFCLPSRSGHYRLRIFTPEAELPFAGHPSVGTAATLVRLGVLAPGRLRQECGVGVVDLNVTAHRAELETSHLSVGAPVDPAPLLAAAGLEPADLAGECRIASSGVEFAVLPVRPDAVARARFGFGPPVAGPLGLYVMSWSAGSAHARMVGAGVDEDPATGSAALALGAYLAAAGLLPDGETGYDVRQGEEIGRPSRLRCSVTVEGGRAVAARVAGDVVPVASGEISAAVGRG
jgi:trans-2,3-dihydro-3-hydroxyanthranilate isomerase